MSDERRRGGLGAAFVLLIFVGAIVKFWVWIAVAFGAAVLFALLLWAAFYTARRVDAREDARLAIAARADQQHAWVLAGDDRGIYGEYTPEVFRDKPKNTDGQAFYGQAKKIKDPGGCGNSPGERPTS